MNRQPGAHSKPEVWSERSRLTLSLWVGSDLDPVEHFSILLKLWPCPGKTRHFQGKEGSGFPSESDQELHRDESRTRPTVTPNTNPAEGRQAGSSEETWLSWTSTTNNKPPLYMAEP